MADLGLMRPDIAALAKALFAPDGARVLGVGLPERMLAAGADEAPVLDAVAHDGFGFVSA